MTLWHLQVEQFPDLLYAILEARLHCTLGKTCHLCYIAELKPTYRSQTDYFCLFLRNHCKKKRDAVEFTFKVIAAVHGFRRKFRFPHTAQRYGQKRA